MSFSIDDMAPLAAASVAEEGGLRSKGSPETHDLLETVEVDYRRCTG